MTELVYERPLIVSVNFPFRFRKLDFGERDKGKFIVFAEDSRIKLYGLLWTEHYCSKEELDAIRHSDITKLLGRLGEDVSFGDMPLGGGQLTADHTNKTIYAGGRSEIYGSIPDFILRGALFVPDYSINTDGKAVARPREYRQAGWYRANGIEIDESRVGR